MDKDIEKAKGLPSPLITANFLSRTYFWWVLPLLKHGRRGQIKQSDIYDCPPEDCAEELGGKCRRLWHNELSSEKPSLMWATVRCFGREFGLYSSFIFFFVFSLQILSPMILGMIIKQFLRMNEDGWSVLSLYIVALCLCAALSSISQSRIHYLLLRLGMRIRVAISSLIYRKALTLSQESLRKTTVGKIVNLLSSDVNRFEVTTPSLPYLLLGPLATAIVIAILWTRIGYASLAGGLVLVFYAPFMILMGKFMAKIRRKTAALTDERIRLMNEIICSMRVIKMYAWEIPFAKLVDSVRKRELLAIRRSAFVTSILVAIVQLTAMFNLLAAFSVYVLLIGGDLTPDKAFVSIALFVAVRNNMSWNFPMAISQGSEMLVSFKRIQDFLLLEEKPIPCQTRPQSGLCGLWMKNAGATWNASEDHLIDITFSVRNVELLAIVGPVGCGKSSLLLSLLGELPLQRGSCVRQGLISYSSQEAWVFGGTLRENILLGNTLDKDRYQKVIDACALQTDIDAFPSGDLSVVGERGVILSGGQKARVNLARAIYLDADIYLLDDPLSAVDTSVAKHLFEKCVNGFLKDKVRILVTHQVQFLKEATRVLVLKEGKCQALGRYDELVEKRIDFGSLLKHEGGNETSEEIRKPAIKNGSAPETQRELQETKVSGSVNFNVYSEFIRRGPYQLLASFMCFVICQVVINTYDFWLAAWTNLEQEKYTIRNCWENYNETFLKPIHSLPESDLFHITSNNHSNAVLNINFCLHHTNNFTADQSMLDLQAMTYYYLLWYVVLTVTAFAFSVLSSYLFFFFCLRASRRLHDAMLKSLLGTSLAFFDNNPVGRVLNRFSKDIGIIDESIPMSGISVLTLSMACVGILGVAAVVQPYLLIPTAVIGVLFYLLVKFYMPSGRDLKRYEGISRSPVFAHLTNSLHGLISIRAFGVQPSFETQFDGHLDGHTATWILYYCASKWLGTTMDILAVHFIAIVATVMTILVVKDSSYASLAGLVIMCSLDLCGRLQFAIKSSAEVESKMTSVERVIEYSCLEPEEPFQKETEPPENWPHMGSIIYRGVSLRYSPQMPYILKNIHFEIKPQEKVGIVGRTGAGKTSLIAALCRLAEPEGQVIIDGISTKDIALRYLRPKIVVIPQDPVLFTGSIRMNLDPFEEYKDDEMRNALEKAHLKNALDESVSEGGCNFSVGQKQLICLARAILRRNKIIVLDEATANVDHKTDSLIQKMLRECFENCTVLVVAHRLQTVMDSHRVMVMEGGELHEFDEPFTLLQNPRSLFSQMVQVTGPGMAQQLKDMAHQAHIMRIRYIGPTQKTNNSWKETTRL